MLALTAGALLGCRPGPGTSEPETATRPDVAWMPGQDPERESQQAGQDETTDELRCAENYEAPGCPWARTDAAFGDEGVHGNASPRTAPLPEPVPEACPDSAVMGQMIEIPAGEFTMGCEDLNSKMCGKAEREQVVVDLPAFSLDRTEVTQAAYQRCVEAGSCTPPAGGFEPTERCTHPVANVSWRQASRYCAWQDKRLPTEAEWEKAARGTDGRVYPWGDAAPTCELANFEGCGLREAQAVASHPEGASPYGVQDMAGNVREWVFDKETARGSHPKRGIRGGMFTDQGIHLRAARRTWGDVSVSDLGIGFRCAQ